MTFVPKRAALRGGVAAAALIWQTNAWAQERTFDVPAAPAFQTIPEFARQAGIQILAPAEQLNGIQTPAVIGEFELHAALAKLLAGTSVRIASDDGRTIILTTEENAAPNPSWSMETDATPPQRPLPPEEVLITGSLIRGAMAMGASVVKIGSPDFLAAGALNVTDALRNIPLIFVNPSASPQATFSNLGKVSPINIHGVGSLETLLLVDGMRTPLLGKNRFNDPSIIPTIAIDHIDVLPDGASATYGSDAVAGVVNVILKRRIDAIVSQASLGFADGFAEWQGAQLFGRTWDSGGIVATFSDYNRDALHAADRPSLYTFDLTTIGFSGQDRTSAGSSIPATLSTGAPVYLNGIGGVCSNCRAGPVGLGPTAVVNYNSLVPGTDNETNVYNDADIFPSEKRASATLAFDQDINPAIHLFLDAYYSNRRAFEHYAAGFSPATNSADTNISIPANYPFLASGYPDGLRANYDFAPVLNPYIAAVEVDGRYAGGFDVGLPAAWHGKISYAMSQTKLAVNQENLVNKNNVSALLGNMVTAVQPGTNLPIDVTRPPNLPILNIFCDPAQFSCLDEGQIAFIRAFSHELSVNSRQEAGSIFDGPLFSLPGGIVRLALGGDVYRDHYSITLTSAINSVSAQLPLPARVENGTAAYLSRNVISAFAELNIPLIGAENQIPFVRKLEMDISARYDRYDDFGSTANPKLNANWIVLNGLDVHGSWGTSFRAPTLTDTSAVSQVISGTNGLGGAGSSASTPNCPRGASQPTPGSSGAAILAAVGGTCATNPFSYGLNVKGGAGGLAGILRPAGSELGPETAESWTLGARLTPPALAGLDIDMTYYRLSISDVLGAVSSDDRLVNPDLAFSNMVIGQPGFETAVKSFLSGGTSQVVYSPSAAASVLYIADAGTANLGVFHQSGLDFRINYTRSSDTGIWSAGAVGSYIFHQRYSPAPGVAMHDIAGTLNSGPENLGSIRFRLRGNLGWTSPDHFSITAYANYQSHYRNTQALAFPDIVPAFTTFDVALAYDLGRHSANAYLQHLTVNAVVNNVLDKMPPFVAYTQGGGGTTTYDGVNFSPAGRMAMLTIIKDW